jgi:hypothetical protein
MSRNISRAEAWERAHEAFAQVNFNAFDYVTIKESLLDYMKLYYSEDFNDYIESSEFIALLELFAYVGELLAYRLDMNAHENFITTAQRKESILRLAKLISYKASRNIPARGLVKITGVQTTETVIDSDGRNLAGRRIIWNDSNNPDWKEQFLLVMNRVLDQEFGTVAPTERVQIDDVLFELYTLDTNPLNTTGRPTLTYSATVTGETFPMELVSVNLTETGPEEKRPEVNGKFGVLYASDGLGDRSDTTGFLMYTKQGTLQRLQTNFDGITPNQTFDININNINETDVWVNNVDPETREIISVDPYKDVLPHVADNSLRYGEWIEVDAENSQNIIFNTNRNRRKYEIETLDADQVRLIFGDGEFAEIPAGAFDIWYRTSANRDIAIPRSSVVNHLGAFTYNDTLGNVQTFTFTFSLIGSLQNASPSEDLEHIRRVAPSVYYTQDRMVNGRDYNSFMLQDPSILRMRSINRTFAGDSKYIAWRDPKEHYENVKIFGDDLALYWVDHPPLTGGLTQVTDFTVSNSSGALDTTTATALAEGLVLTYVEPLICTLNTDVNFFAVIADKLQDGGLTNEIRCSFTEDERNTIVAAIAEDILITSSTTFVDLWYSAVRDEWTIGQNQCDITPDLVGCDGAANSVDLIRIEAKYSGSNRVNGWNVRWRTRRMVAHSPETLFWHTNDVSRTIDFDTLNTMNDYIAILKANSDSSKSAILTDNINFTITGQELVEESSLPNIGLPDQHRVAVIRPDVNGDGIPDDILVPTLFDRTIDIDAADFPDIVDIDDPSLYRVEFDETYFTGLGDEEITIQLLDADMNVIQTLKYNLLEWFDNPISENPVLSKDVRINQDPVVNAPTPVATIRVIIHDFVYFKRLSNQDPWEPIETTTEVKQLWAVDQGSTPSSRLYKRHRGRYPMNFAWFHFTPRLNLIDPAASNIIDMYIVTRGYYLELRRWVEGRTSVRPTAPTPLELRNTYNELLNNKMISDTVILHPGDFKILFGSKSTAALQARFSVIRPALTGNLTDNEVKVRIVNAIRRYFDINDWEFGETFYFTELAAAIHTDLGPEIDSIVLVPIESSNQFGDMFQVMARENELFIPDISTADIEIVQSYTPETIRQTSN